MRTVWIASAVFFIGALASVAQGRTDATLLFAALGFGMVQIAESNIDWRERITRKGWKRTIFEPKWQITVVGRLAQILSFVCLFGFFVVVSR